MDEHIHGLREHIVEAIGQVALHDVHERIGRRRRVGLNEAVGEYQPVDRCAAERPRLEQSVGDLPSQEAETTRDDDPHAFSPW